MGHLRSALIIITIVVASAGSTLAQQIVEPPRGSRMRAQLLDVARPIFEREIQGRVQFVVRRLAVMEDWAFGHVAPQRPGGRPIDWRNTKFRAALAAGQFFPEHSLFLLKQINGTWAIVEYAIGPSDPVWEEWLSRHNLPRQLFE
jgi:hypothetical protein